jgi:hypothetical protein
MRLHHALVRAASLVLMICVGSAAVQVRAQDSLAAEPPTKECPDLSGTYESRSTAWIDKFHLHATKQKGGVVIYFGALVGEAQRNNWGQQESAPEMAPSTDKKRRAG